ncbi:MAG: thioredoxin family protein [Phycisphaerales bacterium]|jgi:peroxiredoxin
MGWFKRNGMAMVGTIAAMTAATSLSVALAGQDGNMNGQSARQGVTAGEKAPMFTLKDTEGKEHSLKAILAKDSTKAVVIEWFNPGCPFVKKHHRNATTMTDLAKEHKNDGVVWIAINSGAEGKQGAGIETNKEAIEDFKITYPVLMDMDGKVGKAYGAKRTPEMYVVAKDGTVVYHGAIDSDPSPRTMGEVNYVAEALKAYMAGETVATPRTQAYGCTVKYSN